MSNQISNLSLLWICLSWQTSDFGCVSLHFCLHLLHFICALFIFFKFVADTASFIGYSWRYHHYASHSFGLDFCYHGKIYFFLIVEDLCALASTCCIFIAFNRYKFRACDYSNSQLNIETWWSHFSHIFYNVVKMWLNIDS